MSSGGLLPSPTNSTFPHSLLCFPLLFFFVAQCHRPGDGNWDLDAPSDTCGQRCAGCCALRRQGAQQRETARRHNRAEAQEEARDLPEEGVAHWITTRVNNRGVVGLPCVTHTCGMTRLEIPEGEFFAFYTLPHCSRELYRYGWTVVNFGLNVWLSVPRFGPREW